MPRPSEFTEWHLELRVRKDGARHQAQLHLRSPRGDDVQPSAWFELSPDALAGLLEEARFESADPVAEGRRLTETIFSNEGRYYWSEARTRLDDDRRRLRLHLRLMLEESAQALHALRWELLRDPIVKEIALASSHQVYFSRYPHLLAGAGPVAAPGGGPLSVLVLVANPKHPRLAPIDVGVEMAAVQEALGGAFRFTFLGRTEGVHPEIEPAGAATRANLLGELQHGHDVVYLVAHGRLDAGGPRLWLERDDGSSDPVEAEGLAVHLRQVSAPRLVVLASCQSAQTPVEGARDTLIAIAPRLAWAGVGAVIGMQGDLRMATARSFVPRFFAALHRHGGVDRALAEARARLDLEKHPDWWMPVLFLRVEHGRLFAGEGAAREDGGVAAGGELEESFWQLSDLLRQGPIPNQLQKYRASFRETQRLIERLKLYKNCHDELQAVDKQHKTAFGDEKTRQAIVRLLPLLEIPAAARTDSQRDELEDLRDVWDGSIASQRDQLEGALLRFLVWARAVSKLSDEPRRLKLQREIERAQAAVAALEKMPDTDHLRLALLDAEVWQKVPRLVQRGLEFSNEESCSLARTLNLDDVVAALDTVVGHVEAAPPGNGPLANLREQAGHLRSLKGSLERLVAEHGGWQIVDTTLRTRLADTGAAVGELREEWDDLTPQIDRLLDYARQDGRNEEAQLLEHRKNAVGEAFTADGHGLPNVRRIVREIGRFRDSAVDWFERVDKKLLQFCTTELIPLRRVLDALLEVTDAAV